MLNGAPEAKPEMLTKIESKLKGPQGDPLIASLLRLEIDDRAKQKPVLGNAKGLKIEVPFRVRLSTPVGALATEGLPPSLSFEAQRPEREKQPDFSVQDVIEALNQKKELAIRPAMNTKTLLSFGLRKDDLSTLGTHTLSAAFHAFMAQQAENILIEHLSDQLFKNRETLIEMLEDESKEPRDLIQPLTKLIGKPSYKMLFKNAALWSVVELMYQSTKPARNSDNPLTKTFKEIGKMTSQAALKRHAKSSFGDITDSKAGVFSRVTTIQKELARVSKNADARLKKRLASAPADPVAQSAINLEEMATKAAEMAPLTRELNALARHAEELTEWLKTEQSGVTSNRVLDKAIDTFLPPSGEAFGFSSIIPNYVRARLFLNAPGVVKSGIAGAHANLSLFNALFGNSYKTVDKNYKVNHYVKSVFTFLTGFSQSAYFFKTMFEIYTNNIVTTCINSRAEILHTLRETAESRRGGKHYIKQSCDVLSKRLVEGARMPAIWGLKSFADGVGRVAPHIGRLIQERGQLAAQAIYARMLSEPRSLLTTDVIGKLIAFAANAIAERKKQGETES